MPSAVDYLIATQHQTGGWGYSPSHEPVVEPTAVALLALRAEAGTENAVQRSTAWLLKCQNRDGGWGINENDLESGWQTAWSLTALRHADDVSEPIGRAVDWLTHEPTAQISREEFQADEIPSSVDPGAMVWPWIPGQVCWVEPTALAVLALFGLKLSALADTRLNAAINYLQLNRTPRGGWDIGNAGPLDVPVIPRAYQTSLVLMALAMTEPDQVLPEDLSALKLDLEQDSSALSLACGLLSLRLLGEDDPALQDRLSRSQKPNGSWSDNPFFTGWAVMALRGYI